MIHLLMSSSNKNQFHATDTFPKSDNFQTLGIKNHAQAVIILLKNSFG